MGVDYALKGTVEQSRGVFRVTAQLVRAATGQPVWAERYDRQASAFLDVHDEVIRRIASSLKIQMTERERRRIARLPTRSLADPFAVDLGGDAAMSSANPWAHADVPPPPGPAASRAPRARSPCR